MLPHSPARNAGSNALISGVTQDLAGGARLLNGTVDMGAYETLWVEVFLVLLSG